MSHPLTDDTISAKKWGYPDEYGNWYYDEDDMRAAADWQLEQCAKCLRDRHLNDCAEILKEAMRSQQQQEDNND